jgi:hypothetical protein
MSAPIELLVTAPLPLGLIVVVLRSASPATRGPAGLYVAG